MILSDCEAFEETQWKHICIGKSSFMVCMNKSFKNKIYIILYLKKLLFRSVDLALDAK